jgi:hypothetical protein
MFLIIIFYVFMLFICFVFFHIVRLDHFNLVPPAVESAVKVKEGKTRALTTKASRTGS